MQIPKEWLKERVDSVPTTYHRGAEPSAALRTRMVWQKIKGLAAEGDEVWSFSSPPSRFGREKFGYALVRDGEIVESALVIDG